MKKHKAEKKAIKKDFNGAPKKVTKMGAFKRIWLNSKKSIKILGWAFLILLSATMPQLFASSYEYSCYARSVGSNKILAAHYTNMITFGYNIAAMATVVLVYLSVHTLKREFKKPNYLVKYCLDHSISLDSVVKKKGIFRKREK